MISSQWTDWADELTSELVGSFFPVCKDLYSVVQSGIPPPWTTSKRLTRQSVFYLFYPGGSTDWFRSRSLKPSNSASCDPELLIELRRHEILTVCLSGSPSWKCTVHPWPVLLLDFFPSWMKIKGAKTQITLSTDAEMKRHHIQLSFMPSWLKVAHFDAFRTRCDQTWVNTHVGVLKGGAAGARRLPAETQEKKTWFGWNKRVPSSTRLSFCCHFCWAINHVDLLFFLLLLLLDPSNSLKNSLSFSPKLSKQFQLCI